MSSNPEPAPRRSGRERKQADFFKADGTRKRKHGSEGPSDTDDVEDHEEEEQDEEVEEPPSGDEHEEDYVAPKKVVARKPIASKAKAQATDDEDVERVTKKPRAARAPRIPKVGGLAKPRRRKPKGDGDADPKAIAKQSSISDDNVLFNAILNPSAALQSVAEDFIDSYGRASGPALADFINCVLRSCGSNASVDADQVVDTDGVVDWLDDLMDAMKKETSLAYPLASKQAVFKRFRKSLSELISRIIASAAETGAVYDEEFIPIIQTWVIAMSSAQLRSFRHTATVVGLEIESALAEVASVVDKEAEVLRRQRDSEKKKGTSGAKGRGQDIQAKYDDVQKRRKSLKEFLKEFFEGLFVLRYRDADPGIRADCVQEFGVWIERYPTFFLEGNHLRYVGWVLSDTNTQVRVAAVRSLNSLYKRSEYLNSINHFTQRFKQRLVDMATSDIEVTVRVAVIQVLEAIDALGELDEEQVESLQLLIFDQEPRVRKAVGAFIRNVWSAGVDDRLARKSGTGTTTDKTRIGFKCLASLLVKWTKKLETDQSGETVPEQTESQEDGDAGDSPGQRSKELTAVVADQQRGRLALCVDSLWDQIDCVSDWHGLIEYLLLDHSQEGGDDVMMSPVATKRKKAAEAKAKKNRAKKNASALDEEVDELWRLEEGEEGVLMEVLIAVLRKVVLDAVNGKKSDTEMALIELTEALMKTLPQLFAKNQADERRIAEVILIPQLMHLNTYAEMGMKKAYEALWDEITKHFLAHSSPIVVRHAAMTISHLISATALFSENDAKMTQLDDELASGFRDAVVEKEDIETEYLEDDDVRLLAGFAFRAESLFRIRDMTIWMDDDEGGKQSSIWNILIALAARGSRGQKGEEGMLDHIFQALTFQMAWKVKNLPSRDPAGEDEVRMRTKLQEQRDQLVERLDSCAFGPNSRAGDSVRRSAVKCLILLYTLFLPKQGDAEGHPYPASSMPLEVTDEMQYRLEGFIEAEVERYADDIAEALELAGGHRANGADSTGDESDAGGVVKEKSKKKRAVDIDAIPRTQAQLEAEYVFVGVIASFLSAMKAGIVQIKHTAKPLAYYGRLGATFDQCMKVVIELLREEGMYKSHGFIVADVVKGAIKESFDMYLDGRSPSEDHALDLAKALQGALIVRGAQLSVIHKLDSDSLTSIHCDSIDWITRKIRGYESINNKKLRNSAIEFFHVLALLLPAVTKAEAETIKSHLDKSLAAAKVEPSPTARFWEPLRSYEKRLLSAATKGKEQGALCPKKKQGRKSARSDDEGVGTTDGELVLEDPIIDVRTEASPSRNSPKHSSRSYGRQSAAGPSDTNPKSPQRDSAHTRPRPKPRLKRKQPQSDVVQESDPEVFPPRSNSGRSPLKSPELQGESMEPDHSLSPQAAAKRKRNPEDDFEVPIDFGDNEEEEDAELEGAHAKNSPANISSRKHHSRPSSQISEMSQLDIDFFKTRKRIRR